MKYFSMLDFLFKPVVHLIRCIVVNLERRYCGINNLNASNADFVSCCSTTQGKTDTNKIIFPQNKNVQVTVRGNNNTVIIDNDITDNSFLQVIVVGDNNFVEVQKSNINMTIVIGEEVGHPTNNAKIVVGKNLFCNGAKLLLLEDNSSISIGEDCMFSWGIELRGTDSHTIFDSKTKKILNRAKTITIGKHVWIGRDVFVMKNTNIPDNCIVGVRSVITKKFTQTNCVIAGVPAKVVKENVNWDRLRPDLYEKSFKS